MFIVKFVRCFKYGPCILAPKEFELCWPFIKGAKEETIPVPYVNSLGEEMTDFYPTELAHGPSSPLWIY